MPGALRWFRASMLGKRQFGRYLGYAAGEVSLIFIGISLAIAFDNSVEARRATELEHDVLLAIHSNLMANVVELDRNIGNDERSLGLLDPLVEHFSQRLPWNDSLAARLTAALPWSSPYLATAGYESLKQLGLHVVADEALQGDLVHLYEGTYARLLGDTDRAQWAFYAAVLLPVRNRELELSPSPDSPPSYRPRNYFAALERGDLLSALADHSMRKHAGLRVKRTARVETNEVAEEIESYLSARRVPLTR